MKNQGLSQSDVCKMTGLPIAIISRVVRNKDDKGSQYSPKIQTVKNLIKGLAKSQEDAYSLLYSAYPDLKVLIDLAGQNQETYEKDIILYDLGYMDDLS